MVSKSKVSVWILADEHDGEDIQSMVDEDIEQYEADGWWLVGIDHIPVDRRAVMLLRFRKNEF